MKEMNRIGMNVRSSIFTCIPRCEKGIYSPYDMELANGGRYCE